MQNTFTSLKNKIVKRYTVNDENFDQIKSTNINVLLNRVSVNKRKEFQKKIDRKSRRVGKECRSRWSPYH